MVTQLINTWTREPLEESSMTADHTWIWREMISAIDEKDLSKQKVLDFGCNQGGFLRLLFDQRPFAAGVGIDLAQKAVDIAEARKEGRPIDYRAVADLAELGETFDLAFSHEVIYLIEDLARHAAQIASVLKPGGNYYAVTCCHKDSPLWASWRPKIQAFSNINVPDHRVEDISSAFRRGGFDVAVSRFLASAFIPLEGPSEFFPSDVERLECYANWKLLFRMTRS
ncbi:class I SAM-dependent methyltransferase [uncultured Roseibium sp.]|uniref:class I SAM-dependent methyltransferase n=1 Tax=uncultured Roseibium sp. TaxID=1936171 RepID=UPI002629CA96|nr:class I SAM-dependent methyltransferase [uncultured Roseibium sp.]